MPASELAVFLLTLLAALGRTAAEAGVAAMQQINVVVLGSWLLRAFFATALLSVAAIVAALWRWQRPASVLLIVAGALYPAGSFVVTIACNVPRNNALARDGARVWADYLVTWTRWNHVRTASSLAAAALFTLALWHSTRWWTFDSGAIAPNPTSAPSGSPRAKDQRGRRLARAPRRPGRLGPGADFDDVSRAASPGRPPRAASRRIIRALWTFP
jgi:uncharacterized membrane protein